MRTKTIKTVLSKKFNDWAESISDESVKKLVKANSIITGGAITSLLLNEAPKDFDIYFKDKATVLAVADYYCKQFIALHGRLKNNLDMKCSPFVLDGEAVEKWKQGTLRLSEVAPNYKQDFEYTTGVENVSHMITNTPPERVKIIFPSDGVIGEEGYVEDLDDADEIPVETLEELPQEKTEKPKYRPVFLTTNAISLSNGVQLIIRFYGEPDKIHETYDFEHCCCYWTSNDGKLVTPEKALLSILNKNLFYRGSKYPVCSIIRAKKFLKRGWKINAGQYVKMAFQVSELDLSDVDVLEDQLVGIDTLYFRMAIKELRRMKENNKDFSFDSSYFATIIDKIF